MDYDKGVWVVCLVIFIIVGLNAMIYAAFKGDKSGSMSEIPNQVTKPARNPWKAEDANLAELSQVVSGLKKEIDSPQAQINDEEAK